MDVRLAEMIARGFVDKFQFTHKEWIEAHQLLIDHDLKWAIQLQHKDGWSVGRVIQELLNAKQIT